MLKPDINFSHKFSDDPFIAVSTESGKMGSADEIAEISFNGGLIVVDNHRSGLPPRQQLYSVLAGIGLSNKQIGKAAYVGEDTVKTGLQRSYDKLEINDRKQLAPLFMEIGVFNCVTAGRSLCLTDPEIAVVASQTAGYKQAVNFNGEPIALDTSKSHLKRISKRSGLKGTASIILGSLLSGETLPDIGREAIPNF